MLESLDFLNQYVLKDHQTFTQVQNRDRNNRSETKLLYGTLCGHLSTEGNDTLLHISAWQKSCENDQVFFVFEELTSITVRAK